MDLVDATGLASHQLDIDRKRTKRFPDLLARKMERMSLSPLAFLRGAAPMFYEMLESNPDLAEGPPGEGWIVGDLHVENFGAYSADSESAVFDLNDFDDTMIGPWRIDVLRLMTSLILAGRELGANGLLALELCDHLLGAWARAAFDGEPPPRPPPPVAKLVKQMSSRSRKQLLDARTVASKNKRRFARGPRYRDLPAKIRKAVPKAFAKYIASVAPEERPHGSFEIMDAALRVAGTGSLGCLRIAVLVEGKGGVDGGWIYDLKEQGPPSGALLFKPPRHEPAARVVAGFRACVAHPAREMGTTTLGKLSLFGRRLSPQEDKLDLRHLRGNDLPALATYLGAKLGTAHVRGATKPPRKGWSHSDLETLRAHAITLAGVHEAIYLALCEEMRHILR